jgi:hypothetical protein
MEPPVQFAIAIAKRSNLQLPLAQTKHQVLDRSTPAPLSLDRLLQATGPYRNVHKKPDRVFWVLLECAFVTDSNSIPQTLFVDG